MALACQFSENAQLLAFVLQEGASWNADLLQMLESAFGRIRHLGKLFPFNRTNYYEPEMGTNLFRGVLSFETLVAPETISAEKQKSNALEIEFSESKKRKVNIDVGYMDLDKVVLPSFKRGPFKLYAGEGVWLDMLLTYAKGNFKPTAWAFEDFKQDFYTHDLILIREKFKKSFSKKGK